MRILGLDPSLTAYGWCLHETEASGPARCVARGRISSSSKMAFVDRYTGARETLRCLVREYQPDAVGIESPFCGGSYSEGMYGLFLYTNEAMKAERRDVVYFSPLQVKAAARELLRRPDGWVMMKPDMVSAAKADTGLGGSWDHNEADAYLVARLAGRFWGLYREALTAADLTPTERKFFSAEHTFVRGKNAGKTERTGLLFREEDRFFVWSKTSAPESGEAPVLTLSYPRTTTPPKKRK